MIAAFSSDKPGAADNGRLAGAGGFAPPAGCCFERAAPPQVAPMHARLLDAGFDSGSDLRTLVTALVISDQQPHAPARGSHMYALHRKGRRSRQRSFVNEQEETWAHQRHPKQSVLLQKNKRVKAPKTEGGMRALTLR